MLAKSAEHDQTMRNVASDLVLNYLPLSTSSQSLRFILSLRLYSSFITSRPDSELFASVTLNGL